MTLTRLLARDAGSDSNPPTSLALLVALFALVLAALLCALALYLLRRLRKSSRKEKSQLPTHNGETTPSASRRNHRRLTIQPNALRDSVHVFQEKQNLIENSHSPPDSPIPEIRITFPEEVDESGKRQSGAVVVVRVGEHSIGLEPLEEDLPPYQRDTSERFDSVDLDRIGGLKEKNANDKKWS